MSRSPNKQHDCPLYHRKIYWSECYEVQEVREDSMSEKLLYEPIKKTQADEICSKCKWYFVGDNE